MPIAKTNSRKLDGFLVSTPKDFGENVRSHFDPETKKWHFSIVDVIAELTDSSDARNYWKVLKNRLKKTDFELVTSCNQLKMEAKDGKFYLTDTADSEILSRIIRHIPSANFDQFDALIRNIIEQKKKYESQFVLL